MASTFRGKYFQDFNVGDEFYTPARTVTEADIINWSYLSGDWNPVHTNEEFAKKSDFKTRIAHGPLSLGIATGLMDRIGIIEGTALALLTLSWKFTAPVYIGDTISLKMVATQKKETRKDDRGIVIFNVSLFNQREEVVSEGTWDLLIKARQ
jgi:acyl dehydratase